MVIQIFIVGSQSCGKTSLVTKLLQGRFPQETEVTIYPGKYHGHQFEINDSKYKAQIVDLPAFDLNPGILSIPQYKQCKGFFIVFDLTSRASFQNAQLCWRQIKENVRLESQHAILLGNKKDLNTQIKVGRDEIQQFVLEEDLDYHEISAKTDSQNVLHQIFVKRAKMLINKVLIDESINDSQKNIILKTSEIPANQEQLREKRRSFWDKFKNCLGLN